MRRLLIVALALALRAQAAWELTYQVKTTDLYSVALHHGMVFTGSDDAVLVSSNHGQSWTKTSLTSRANEILGMGDTLFAATKDKGVQRSLDDGKTWNGVSGATGEARAMVLHEGHLFAATNGGGVHRSDDAGRTWQTVNNGLGSTAAYCLASGGGYVFAGTAKNGVYRSADLGAHWESINNGFNSTGCFFLAFDGKVLFAVPIDHKGVIHSDDLGKTWNTDITGQGTLPYPHSLEAYGPNVFFINAQDGGVQLTKDGGKTIIHVNQPKSPVQPRYIGLADGYLFVMDFQNGIWRKPISELDLAPIPVGIKPHPHTGPLAAGAAPGLYSFLADGRTLPAHLRSYSARVLSSSRARQESAK